MGLMITKENMQNKLLAVSGGEALLTWGYAPVAYNFTFWKNAFYYVGLTNTRLLLLRVGSFTRRPKGLTAIPLTEISAAAYADIGNMLTSHIIVLITRAGVKYPLQFPYIIGQENPGAAKEIYNHLVAEKNAGRLNLEIG